ncbi:hypothetical protein J8M21_25770, partial [Pseudoalteromonas luteoviolacea]|uniref:condensation domain-containing protein n=1 Tax=Pseudoalteromonas luteoviolacea TaxID=43657 RepID=UPI001B4181A4
MTLLTELKELLKNGIEVKQVGEKLKVEAIPGALKTEQTAFLKQQKENILRLFHSLTITSNRDYEFLSFAQQRLWLLDQLDGGSHQYNMPMALKLNGVLDEGAMQRAFTDIVARHESLRTCFVAADGGQPLQIITEKCGFDVPLTDLSELPKEVQQTQVEEAALAEAEATFDLSRDLMMRARLLKLSGREHVLLVTMHHIASDGWSMGILVNEFSRLYSAYVQGEESPLTPLAIQYADYAHWQREWLQSNKLDEQLAYWQDKLSGLPALHNLPLDKPRPSAQGFNGETYVSCIAQTELASLKKLCQAKEATLFMGLHAVFSVLMSRYSNEKDIVVGTPVANREQMEVADLIGFFVNTLVLRSDLSGEPVFLDVLAQSKQMLLDAYNHQQVPFEQVVERLQPERSLSHSPLFQVMLALQNNEQGNLSLPGISLSPLDSKQGGVSQFDLTLNVAEKPDGLTLRWVFNTALFERDTIARMATHFEALLSALVQAPEQDVFSHALTTAQEQELLLNCWNDTAAEVPLEYCLHELFAEQASHYPEKTALICDDSSL